MAFTGNDDGPVAYINVAPLVDVMLVLLVIFMVTAPMLQQGVEVNLPEATTAPLEGDTEQLVISVDAAGKIFLGAGNEFASEEIAKKVATILKTRKADAKKVYIKGDESIDYGVIMEVMGALHREGVYQIGLVSAPPTGKKSG